MANNTPTTGATTNKTSSATPIFRYDEYWLEKGKRMVDGTLDGFQKRITSYITFLNFIAAGTFIGGITYTTYLKSTDPIVYLCFILPLGIIAAAKYYVGIANTQPSLQKTDMRSPGKINEAFNRIVQRQNAKLKDSQAWVGLATLFVLIFIPLGTFLQNLNEAKPALNEFSSVKMVGKSIVIEAFLPKVNEAQYKIFGIDTKTKKPTFVVGSLNLSQGKIFSSEIDTENMQLTPTSIQLDYTQEGKVKSVKYLISGLSKPAQEAVKIEKGKEDQTDNAKIQ